jgi:MoxR-like ATPase
MFMILVDYPSEEEEVQIMKRTTALEESRVEPVLSGADILRLQDIVRRVLIGDDVIGYVLRLTRSTRVSKPESPQFIKDLLAWGAGPRASQYLILGGKVRALLHGREQVSKEDIQAVAHPVLRHRIITNFSAEAEGITPDKIIDRLLAETEENSSRILKDSGAPKILG